MTAAAIDSKPRRALAWRAPAWRVVQHALLLAGALVMLAPFVWMLVTSLRSPSEIFEASWLPWPRSWFGWGHYAEVLRAVPIGRFMLNGLLVCGGILMVQLLVAVPAAYALAKLPFRGSGLFFLAVLAALAVPIQATALPLYIGLSGLGVLNSYFAQMLPFFLSLFAIFLLRQFFRGFPDEVIHAARVDGMSELEILWRIVLPSARPAIAAFAVFSFVAHWNDLYWPMVVITSTELAPPPLGMLLFASAESGANYGALMAGAALITAPLVLAFLVARRRFIQGITMTGMR
ncbi:MAG: carbohydrate ABC transporter permease [Leptothrix sp. (in: Bacteria)]|nr:carbohydrate ABC transporter permease [Leptothrix sp. (in: b-proteobacteria)]